LINFLRVTGLQDLQLWSSCPRSIFDLLLSVAAASIFCINQQCDRMGVAGSTPYSLAHRLKRLLVLLRNKIFAALAGDSGESHRRSSVPHAPR
jgi:hypothetical protein